ncbi:carbamoyltransferase HypF [bacterium]|nr:MAG: carbamoyltransferase HypF [bacterium]
MKLKKIKLDHKIKKPVLSLGSQRKNTLCFAQGYIAYLSPEHPDLNNPQDFFSFQNDFKYLLRKKPRIIAYDLHPEYQSTKYIFYLKPNTYHLEPIQHHHAHIVSCMAENSLKNQKVIGVAFDGAGLGIDNHFWGGEFFICDYQNYQRMAHLREIPLIGAEQAIMEPWRVAATWLYLIYGDKFLNLKIDLVKRIKRKNWGVLKEMYLSGFNSPLTSSAGRLFDAAASLIFNLPKVNIEAELAIRLENAARDYRLKKKGYKFSFYNNKGFYIIDPIPLFRELVSDLKAKEDNSKMAYRFHLTMAQMIRRAVVTLRHKTKINQVVLSGGVFQNNLLLKLTLDLLYKERFWVLCHRKLSCNDSSISLGQAIIANSRR